MVKNIKLDFFLLIHKIKIEWIKMYVVASANNFNIKINIE